MFRVLSLCTLFLVAASAVGVEDDAKVMQGTWVIDSAMLAGRDHTEDFAGMKLILEGDKYTVEFDKNTDKGTFKLDGTRKPARIDITSVSGPFKGKTLPGIYELKGDTLTLCFNADGKADLRPEKFAAPEMTRTMLLKYKREKK